MSGFWGSQARSSIHSCAGAGRWFPASSSKLREEVNNYMKSPAPSKTGETAPPSEGRIAALIVPHAGYVYCGRVAGEAFRTLQGNKNIQRVVILAFSHSVPFSGISVLDVESYETPLGSVPVDRESVARLLKDPLFKSISRAHSTEHSDENQLPFLQTALGDGFKLVSLLVGDLSEKDFDRAAETLRPIIDDHTVIVTSSDFTHYGLDYGYAPFEGQDVKKKMADLDRGAIDQICSKQFKGFRDYLNQTGATICGRQPISLLIKVLPPEAQGKLLRYETSADVSGGDYSMAVGYAAIAFSMKGPSTQSQSSSEKTASSQSTSQSTSQPAATSPPDHPSTHTVSSKPINPEGPAKTLQNLDILNHDEQQTLLRLARTTLERAFSEKRRSDGPSKVDLSQFSLTDKLKKNFGVFVTLQISGDLRGCIGHIVGRESLYQGVMDNAMNAAFRDPRFPPLAPEELPRVHIEISVLSPLEEVRPEDVVVGRDGLIISKDGYSGVLLPQVPVEWGWTRTEFLEHLCRKAGLPRGSWKDATLEKFGAQVFGEDENKKK